MSEFFELAPLTNGQTEIFINQSYAPDCPIYNIGGYIRFKQDINSHSIERSHNTLVSLADISRMSLVIDSHQRPKIALSTERISPLAIIDLDADDSDISVDQWIHDRFSRPFSLQSNALFESFLIKSECSFYYVMIAHHILMDGWSFALWSQYLIDFYWRIENNQSIDNAVKPAEFFNYLRKNEAYIASNIYQKDKAFWNSTYATLPNSLLTSGQNKTASSSPIFKSVTAQVPVAEKTFSQIRDFFTEHNTSFSTVFIAALYVYFCKTSESEDIVIGVLNHNRVSSQQKNMLGMLVETIPARFPISLDCSFIGLCQSIDRLLYAYYRHRKYPLLDLYKDLGLAQENRKQLFDVLVNYQKLAFNVSDKPDFVESRYVSGGYELVPLYFTLCDYGDSQARTIKLDCDSDQYSRDDAKKFIKRILYIIESGIENAHRPCRESELVSPEEHVVLNAWSYRKTADQLEQSGCSIYHRFSRMSEENAERTALITNSGSITYGELKRKTDRIASRLADIPISQDGACCIAIDLACACDRIATWLAAFKCGYHYLALEAAIPSHRRTKMLNSAQCPLIIVDDISANRYEEIGNTLTYVSKICPIDQLLEEGQQSNHQRVSMGNKHADLANIIFTSGSTGEPKGVVLTQRGILNRLQWMWRTFPYDDDDVCCQKTSLSFVDSVCETWGPLLQGVPLVIASDAERRQPQALAELIKKYCVTRILLVPSMINMLMSHSDRSSLASIKLWISSGEVLTAELSHVIHTEFPNATLLNMYGSSEITADASYHRVSAMDIQRSNIPIGRPLDNVEVLILVGNTLAPIGVEGEICIGGIQLVDGYFNDADETTRRFVQHPHRCGERMFRSGDRGKWSESGEIVYIGRQDDQINILGMRWELGEIESFIRSLEGVSSAAVVVNPLDENYELIAFVVLSSDQASAVKEHTEAAFVSTRLRQQVKDNIGFGVSLSQVIVLDDMPLTISGKIDRQVLANYDYSPTATEKFTPLDNTALDNKILSKLCHIAQDILMLEHVDPDVGFLQQGGTSLDAMKLIFDVKDAYSVDIPIGLILQGKNFSELAAFIDESRTQTTIPSQENDWVEIEL